MTEAIEIPAFILSALQLASGTIALLVDPDPERGLLTKLHEHGVSDTYEAVRAVDEVLRETIDGAMSGATWFSPRAEALVEFLGANIALRVELDAATTMGSLDLTEAHRRVELAWERYRDQGAV